MSEEMIAICGLVCTECPAFLATQSNDDKMRAKVASYWSEEFKANIKPEDVNCNGCFSTDEKYLFSHCKVCEIRSCGLEKEIKNCAYCEEYVCDKLAKFIDVVPPAKAKLEEIRKSIN